MFDNHIVKYKTRLQYFCNVVPVPYPRWALKNVQPRVQHTKIALDIFSNALFPRCVQALLVICLLSDYFCENRPLRVDAICKVVRFSARAVDHIVRK